MPFKINGFWHLSIQWFVAEDNHNENCRPFDSKWVQAPHPSEDVFASVLIFCFLVTLVPISVMLLLMFHVESGMSCGIYEGNDDQ
jgi:hypothetical protein